MITNSDGTIVQVFFDEQITLHGSRSIIGRSFFLHNGEDDGGLKPNDASRLSGNSGARIACGVIGWDKK